jgi:small subunit ribosomal protein S2
MMKKRGYMRRFRMLAVGLVLLLGSWLVWKQVLRRQRTARQNDYAAQSLLPAWSSAPMPTPDPSVVGGTTERTHNQTDSLTQPPEPAAPAHTGQEELPLDIDSTLHEEPAVEPDTESKAEATQPDDLIRIEGIGPKVSTIVAAAGISTFAQLETTSVDELRSILSEANIHTIDPTTWPQQAGLAAQGKWEQLQELQDRIKNGHLEA